MASYKDPELRDRLAAEYVLGTLRGRARARFESLQHYDPSLRRIVAEWEERITPLAGAASEIPPPARVWKAVSRRVAGAARGEDRRISLAFWRGLAVTGAAFTLVLALFIGLSPRPEPPMAMVAVMNDDKGQPAMVVSWPPMKAMRDPHIRIRVVQEHPTMAQGTSWELWMLPPGKAAPVSLGLISTDADQTMKLKAAVATRMEGAWGMAMSVEPEGGSPTGAPTGPVIFKGQCVKIL
ncbi:MAG: anti-sigma factor [Betaproteobacteria bacterium]|nr:anti-sigma factor [Betaproteobacteria bacterium]